MALVVLPLAAVAFLLYRLDNVCIVRMFAIEHGIDPHSDALDEFRSASPHFTPQWAPDGSRIVFATGKRPLTDYPYTRDPFRGTSHAPSGQIYVVASDRSSLLLAADGKSEALYRIAHSPSISPSGSRVAYSILHSSTYGNAAFGYGSYTIETATIDGSDRLSLTQGDVMDFAPAWSPDGSQIAFVRRQDRDTCDEFRRVEIYTIDDNGEGIHKVVDIPSRNGEGTPKEWDAWHHSGPVWSSDGQLLAYVIHETESAVDRGADFASRNYFRNHTTLYTVKADGSDLKRLLTFSSRGRLITSTWNYVAPDEDLRRVGLFSEEPARFIESPPAWSPDRQRIAFLGVSDGVPKLYTLGRHGSDLHEVVALESPRIANPDFLRASPAVFWSRDGSQILFSWDRMVYFVNADGSGFRSIHGGDYFSPSPDGSRIAHFIDQPNVVLYTTAPDGADERDLAKRAEDFVLEAVGGN